MSLWISLFGGLWRARRFWLLPAIILVVLFAVLYFLTSDNDQEAFRYLVF
ncbi:MAG: hypothetical protein KKC51_13530 [Verrucomicrobia bacterium]|nr:hypothetical protein [Verrucomicrobiota bacterium]